MPIYSSCWRRRREGAPSSETLLKIFDFVSPRAALQWLWLALRLFLLSGGLAAAAGLVVQIQDALRLDEDVLDTRAGLNSLWTSVIFCAISLTCALAPTRTARHS